MLLTGGNQAALDVRYTSIFFYPWEVERLLQATCQLIVECRRCVEVNLEPAMTSILIPKSTANRPFHRDLLASILTACLSLCEVQSAFNLLLWHCFDSSRFVWCSYIGQFPLAGQICFRHHHSCTMRRSVCRVVNCDTDTLKVCQMRRRTLLN